MKTQLPSKERLQEIIDVDARFNPEVRAMARALLAAHEQEPVSISNDAREFLAEAINDALGQDSPTELDNQFAADIERLLQPLYTHPAPTIPAAVPEKMTYKEACNFVQINHMATEDRATLVMRTFNHCRAAMLQAEPVSQPYKLPEKVSELISNIRTINRSPQHVARVMGDTAPCYWQRKEWIDWILSLCDEVEQGAKP